MHREASSQPANSAPESRPGWGAATSKRSLSTPWLLSILVWAHLSDVLFQNRWAAFTSGLGIALAILTWNQRGQRFSIRWFICLWGAIEGLEIFVCQGLYNWFPKDGDLGQCSAYTSLPLYGWGTVAVAVLAYWVVKGRS